MPGHAEGLAGESRSDEIHDSTPRFSVEGGKVAPNRSFSHGTVSHRLYQIRRSESLDFHCTDDSKIEASLS